LAEDDMIRAYRMKLTTGIFALLAGTIALLLLPPLVHTGETEPATPDTYPISAFTTPSKALQIACEMGGVLAKTLVKENTEVKKGQVMVELKSDIIKATLEVSKARIVSARLQISAYQKTLAVRKKDYNRLKGLLDQGVGSEEKVDKAKLEMDLALLNLEIAKAQQKVYELAAKKDEKILEQTLIKAPCDGRILRIVKRPGEAVELHAPVLHMVCIDPLYIIAYIPIDTVKLLSKGTKAKMELEDGRKFDCRVDVIDPVADPASGTDRVRLIMDNPGGKILAGSKGKLYFTFAKNRK